MSAQESVIQKSILAYLKYRPGRYWRQNTGAVVSEYKGKKRLIRFGEPGAADITGIKDGKRIEIEVKSVKGRPSDNQIAFKEMIEAEGGVYVLARSLEDVVEAGL